MVKRARFGRSLSAMPPAVDAARASEDMDSSQGSASETPVPRRKVRRSMERCLRMFMVVEVCEVANGSGGGYSGGVNWHQVIDDRNYEMDQVIAKELRESPERLVLVMNWIERKLADAVYSEQNKNALREWKEIIEVEGLDGVLDQLTDRSEEGDRLRQSAPFSILMPESKRQDILKRYESLRTRTSLAGV